MSDGPGENLWRLAQVGDDAAIVAMCVALNREDPGTTPVPEAHTRRTLAELRAHPGRGRAVVLDVGAGAQGYALLIAFWSNELGGEVCILDEIYVQPALRGRGYASQLIAQLPKGPGLWPGTPVALELEVSPKNRRAEALYRRLGFAPVRNRHLRRRLEPRRL